GKTSIARILSREIGTKPEDLYEVDAASNNGVDEIRELTESVNTLPFDSKYKVYILDEVHMLSKSAFNALLKTLEEPPEHVIFILATTEPEKIPDTVISRCEPYTFKKPNQSILKDMVLKVSKKEGFSLEASSADMIALLGDGSFRDTLGILQKVLRSSSDKKISVEEVEKVTGAPKSKLVNDFIEAVARKDAEKGMSAISGAVESNIDMKVYLALILVKLRALLLLKFAPSEEKKMESHFGEDDMEFLKGLAKDSEVKINSGTLLRFLEAYDNIAKSHITQLPLELAFFDVV
ncbi:MAG TPA: AAA family ATPase, partial [Vampirovibrionales bacterium]